MRVSAKSDYALRALIEIAGVTGVDVDLPSGRLTITSDQPLSEDAVALAVDEAGYRLS